MITILTDSDLGKGIPSKDYYEGYDFQIPREALNKSEIILYINEEGNIQIVKHREPIEETLIKLREIGFKYKLNYKIKKE